MPVRPESGERSTSLRTSVEQLTTSTVDALSSRPLGLTDRDSDQWAMSYGENGDIAQ